MAGFVLRLDAEGHAAGGEAGLQGHDFLAALAKIPHVLLRDEDIAWPGGERWEYGNIAQDDWHDPLDTRRLT